VQRASNSNADGCPVKGGAPQIVEIGCGGLMTYSNRSGKKLRCKSKKKKKGEEKCCIIAT